MTVGNSGFEIMVSNGGWGEMESVTSPLPLPARCSNSSNSNLRQQKALWPHKAGLKLILPTATSFDSY